MLHTYEPEYSLYKNTANPVSSLQDAAEDDDSIVAECYSLPQDSSPPDSLGQDSIVWLSDSSFA